MHIDTRALLGFRAGGVYSARGNCRLCPGGGVEITEYGVGRVLLNRDCGRDKRSCNETVNSVVIKQVYSYKTLHRLDENFE